MSDAKYWERQLVSKFVLKSRREQYLSLLKGRKHRKKLLERLNHAFDYDARHATRLSVSDRTLERILELLRRRYVAETCHLMADGNEHDGRELRLEVGVSELLANHWGAVLVCPPKPIALYKEEDVGNLFLLESATT